MRMLRLALLSCAVVGLAGCGGEQIAEVTEAPAAAPVLAPAATAASGATPLPMPLGYYASNNTCTEAMTSPLAGIVIEAEYLRDIDGDYPLLPVTELGGGKFKLGGAIDVLRQTGPKTFIAEEGKEYERRLEWCAEKPPA